MATREQDEWIERVLRVDLASLAGAAPEPDRTASGRDDDVGGPAAQVTVLAARLGEQQDRIGALSAKGENMDALRQRTDAIAALIDDDPDSAEDYVVELDRLVLEAEVAQRASEIPPDARAPLALRRLVTEWQAAQDTASANISAIGQAFLSDRAVQADPRFGDVFAAVKQLDDLLPSFGGTLVETVGAVLNDRNSDPAAVAAGLEAVRDSRSRLNNAATLRALEAVASQQYGGGYEVSGPLADVLDRMEERLNELAA